MSDSVGKAPDAKKRKTNNDGIAAASPAAGASLIDLAAVEKKWSPNREQRYATKKIRSARDGPLRGGDWLLNADGQAATLSFCFEFQREVYGLTVGHLCPKGIGQSIFCFSESTMLENPVPDGDSDIESPGEWYFMFEIGEVVSKSLTTDSLVFKLYHNVVDVADFKTLAELSGLERPLELPDPKKSPKRPAIGDRLVGFGAQRRGAYGIVNSPSETSNGDFSQIGNIGIQSPEGTDKKLTDPGDCGTVFVSLDGTPLYFYHCSNTNIPKTSLGFPLAEVMSRHTQLGGVSELQQEQERAPVFLSTSQSAGLKQFKTVIVDKDKREEENALAQFSPVKVVPSPKESAKLAEPR